MRKISPHRDSIPGPPSPVTSRYTDWATGPTEGRSKFCKFVKFTLKKNYLQEFKIWVRSVELIGCCFDWLSGNFSVFLFVFSKAKTLLPCTKNATISIMQNSIKIWLTRPKISVFSDIIFRFVTAVSTYSLTSICFYLLLHLPLFTNLILFRSRSSYTQKHRYCQFSKIFVQWNQIVFSIEHKVSS